MSKIELYPGDQNHLKEMFQFTFSIEHYYYKLDLRVFWGMLILNKSFLAAFLNPFMPGDLLDNCRLDL